MAESRRSPRSAQVCGPADPRSSTTLGYPWILLSWREISLYSSSRARFPAGKKAAGYFPNPPLPGEAALVSPGPPKMSPPQLLGLCLGIFSIPCSSQPGMLRVSLEMFNLSHLLQVEVSLFLAVPIPNFPCLLTVLDIPIILWNCWTQAVPSPPSESFAPRCSRSCPARVGIEE